MLWYDYDKRSFDKQLEGARQAEAAAARALTEQVSNKNPVALWLDSFLGTPVAKAEEVPVVPAVAAISSGAAVGTEPGEGRSYFQSSVAAYGLGLGLCFAVNFLSKSGQPGKTILQFTISHCIQSSFCVHVIRFGRSIEHARPTYYAVCIAEYRRLERSNVQLTLGKKNVFYMFFFFFYRSDSCCIDVFRRRLFGLPSEAFLLFLVVFLSVLSVKWWWF